MGTGFRAGLAGREGVSPVRIRLNEPNPACRRA